MGNGRSCVKSFVAWALIPAEKSRHDMIPANAYSLYRDGFTIDHKYGDLDRGPFIASFGKQLVVCSMKP
jgi:hypothetical protein